MASPQELADALRAIPPRAAVVLRYRLLEGQTAQQSAERYGVGQAEYDVLLLRSAHPFAMRFGFPHPLPADFAAEQAMAEQLRLNLDDGTVDPLAAPLKDLAAHGKEVLAILQRLEEEYERSPAARRETWLRRLAIVVVLALSAYFYWREKEAPPPHLESREGQPLPGRER